MKQARPRRPPDAAAAGSSADDRGAGRRRHRRDGARARPYGVKGWLKRAAAVGGARRAAAITGAGGSQRGRRRGVGSPRRAGVEAAFRHALVARVDGIDSREAAMAWRGALIGVPAARSAGGGRRRGLPRRSRRARRGQPRGTGARAGGRGRRFRRASGVAGPRRPEGGGRERLIPFVGGASSTTSTSPRTADRRRLGRAITDRGGAMRIDVVTLFPELVEHAARFGVTGRALERGLWRLANVESAGFRDGQLPDRRRPPVRRRTGDGDAGGAAGAGARRGACGAAGEGGASGRWVIHLSPQGGR